MTPASSVQGAPEKAVSGIYAVAAPTDRSLCPECMPRFERRHQLQLFCSPQHRDAWNNRAAVRGRVLTPLAIVARITRNGSRGDRETGARANNEANQLMQRWCDEDRDAGRMQWSEYLRRRYLSSFDPL